MIVHNLQGVDFSRAPALHLFALSFASPWSWEGIFAHTNWVTVRRNVQMGDHVPIRRWIPRKTRTHTHTRTCCKFLNPCVLFLTLPLWFGKLNRFIGRSAECTRNLVDPAHRSFVRHSSRARVTRARGECLVPTHGQRKIHNLKHIFFFGIASRLANCHEYMHTRWQDLPTIITLIYCTRKLVYK